MDSVDPLGGYKYMSYKGKQFEEQFGVGNDY